MCTYYDDKYGQSWSSDGSSTYYDSTYGHTYSTSGSGSTYYDSTYGHTYSTSGSGSTYYDSTYGHTYSTSGSGSTYYDSTYGQTYSSGNYSSSNSDDSYYSGGGGCYISTACLKAKGFSDDCFELTVLRKYRDKLVQEDSEVRKVVSEYYDNAPQLVRVINSHSNRMAIYEYIYRELVVKSIAYLVDGDYHNAIKQYQDVYNKLRKSLAC